MKNLAKLAARYGTKKLVLWGLGLLFPIAIPLLAFFVVVAVTANLAGDFFLGSFTGVHITSDQKKYNQEDAAIKQAYTGAANKWKNGLNTDQQNIVQAYQLYMPASVLLTMGKFVDNYTKKNQYAEAQHFYKLLAPKYTWFKGQGKTITKTRDKNGKINTAITTFTVWELRKAVIWDGTFVSTWGTKTIGGFSNGVGTETIEPYMESETMTYDHSVLYQAAKRYKFSRSDVNPLWFDAIYAMQYSEYQAGEQHAMLKDPSVMQWGEMFGITSPVSPVVSSGGKDTVANPKQIKAWVDQGLALDSAYGIPSTWEAAVIDIIAHEDSSGNPYDVNPQAVDYITGGDPEHASGIMQMMPSTFEAYKLHGHDNIFNPVDNIAAALRYIQAEYHSPSTIPGIDDNRPYIGY